MTAEEWLKLAEERRAGGDEAGALAAYEEAAAQARSIFDPGHEALAMLGVGEMKLLADDYLGARAAFDEAIGRAVEGGARDVETEAWFGFAMASFDAGQSKDGHDALLEAMALARELVDHVSEDRDRKLRLAGLIRTYGEHIGVLGSALDARQALEIARLMFVDLGDETSARGVQEDIDRLGSWAR